MKIYKKIETTREVLESITCDKCTSSIRERAEYLSLEIVTQEGRWYWAEFEGKAMEFCSIACILNFIENEDLLRKMISKPEFNTFSIGVIKEKGGELK